MISVQQYDEIRKRLFALDQPMDAVAEIMGISRSTVAKVSTGIHSYDKQKAKQKAKEKPPEPPHQPQNKNDPLPPLPPSRSESLFAKFNEGFPTAKTIQLPPREKLERCPTCGHPVVLPCLQCYIDWENGLLSPDPPVINHFSKDLTPSCPPPVEPAPAPVSPSSTPKSSPTVSQKKSTSGRRKKGGGNTSKRSRRRQRSSKR